MRFNYFESTQNVLGGETHTLITAQIIFSCFFCSDRSKIVYNRNDIARHTAAKKVSSKPFDQRMSRFSHSIRQSGALYQKLRRGKLLEWIFASTAFYPFQMATDNEPRSFVEIFFCGWHYSSILCSNSVPSIVFKFIFFSCSFSGAVLLPHKVNERINHINFIKMLVNNVLDSAYLSQCHIYDVRLMRSNNGSGNKTKKSNAETTRNE